MENEVLLKVDHLKQYFKAVKAVDDISFEVKKGEVFGLVGESGCGKTTTGRSIIGLYDITGGEVWFEGHRIAAGYRELENELRSVRKGGPAPEGEERNAYLAKLRQQIRERKKVKRQTEKLTVDGKPIMTKMQMIFQDPIASLDPRMTVKEIIAEGLRVQGVKDEKYIEQKVYEVLDLVGLVAEHACRYPHEFSGGQRQRVGIARAIIMQPDLIIADEPISALDVSVQAQVINLLNDLRERMNLTILFIAHDLSVVKYFSDRIAVMYFGKMVELADSEELFAHPLHPYTKSLLSAIPLPDPRYEKRRRRIRYEPDPVDTKAPQQWVQIRPGHFVAGSARQIEAYEAELAR